MRSSTGRVLLSAAFAALLVGVPDTVLAAAAPQVFSVIEGRDSATDRPVLVLVGKSLTKFTGFRLEDPAAVRLPEDLETVLRAKTMLVLGVSAETPPGWYDLVGTFGAEESATFRVCVTNEAPLPGAVSETSLDAALRSDLDDAATLGGQSTSYYRDATNLDAGTLSPDRFSAYGDLVAEAKVGASADQVAAGDHGHDATYAKKADLSQSGTVNDAGNPVDWTRLKGVPADLADGVDGDTTYAAGTGLTLTGTTFSVGSVGWSQLTGVPAGFADGTDADSWAESSGNVYRSSGRAGVGTSSPAATLHVAGNDGALFTGTYGQGSLPATGSGTRMMWYPKKAAFRAGLLQGTSGTEWNDGNIGDFSVAMGANTIASSYGATAFGVESVASGGYSTALCAATTASGGDSFAAGRESDATGQTSTAMGSFTLASGYNSTATGESTVASGDDTFAMGSSTTAQAYASLSLGRYNTVAGTTDSWISTDPLLVAGNGSSPSSRSNAFTLLKNGNLTIAGTLTQNSDARLKKDIAPLAGALGKLSGIRGVSYRFRDEGKDPAGPQVGLLAQEVREAFPELVKEDTQGTLSVAYGNFTAVLVEAVKEQQSLIESQRREIEAAKERLARLEARIGKR